MRFDALPSENRPGRVYIRLYFIFGLACLDGYAIIRAKLFKRKEGHVKNFYFRFYRQRGPVNALQMRLQG